jgi:hypothetical protein
MRAALTFPKSAIWPVSAKSGKNFCRVLRKRFDQEHQDSTRFLLISKRFCDLHQGVKDG